MTQKLKTIILILSLVAFGAIPFAGHASAVKCTDPNSDPACVCNDQGCDNGRAAVDPKSCASGAADATDASKCEALGNDCLDANGQPISQHNCLAKNPIMKDLDIITNFLAGAVGVIVVAMIVTGGIQYSMAGNNPTALTAAKQRITNAIIAMVAFMLIYAFLQWLIPGGIFNS